MLLLLLVIPCLQNAIQNCTLLWNLNFRHYTVGSATRQCHCQSLTHRVHRVQLSRTSNIHHIQHSCSHKGLVKCTVWVKKSTLGDLTFFHFFHKRLRICNRFFTHLLSVPISARLQIFIQLSPILTKLCHIKRTYQVHIISAKCPKRAKTRAFRRLRKSWIALLIVFCSKSL